MKYLKLFEDLKSDGYELVESVIDEDEKLNYTSKEFAMIKSIIPTENLISDVTFIENEEGGSVYFTLILESGGAAGYEYVTRFRKAWIYKLKDEWYFVKVLDGIRKGARFGFKYYKCDQFYGLKNLIQDEIFKII